MNIRKKAYALFLLATFVVSLVFGALHFLEHQEGRCADHSTEKHEKHSDSKNDDCHICYVIFGTTLLSVDELTYNISEPKEFSESKTIQSYVQSIVETNYSSFSLRAPPAVFS